MLASPPNPDGKIRPEYYGTIVENVLGRPNVLIAMSRLIRKGMTGLKTWLVRLCSNRGVGQTGVALLEAQIADLEKRCAAIHHRINRSHPRAGWKRRSEHGADGQPNRRALPGAA